MTPVHAMMLLTLLTVSRPPVHPPAPERPILAAALAKASTIPASRSKALASSPVRTNGRVRHPVIGALIGGAVGGALGYAWTDGCRCDDPGYGVFLGAPIGALAGAVVGALER